MCNCGCSKKQCRDLPACEHCPVTKKCNQNDHTCHLHHNEANDKCKRCSEN